MLIFIEGSESFLALQIIKQLKQKYLAKNPDGVELIDVDASDLSTSLGASWADLQAAPLFAQSRLIFIRQAASLPVGEQDSLARYLQGLPASSVVAVWDGKPLKKGQLLDILSKAKRFSAALPVGSALNNYLEKRAKQHQLVLPAEQRSRLQNEFGHDLWALETELAVLSLGAESGQSRQIASEPFAFYRSVQQGNWAQAKKLMVQDYEAGTPIELIIGSAASALRKTKASDQHRQAVETLSDIDLGLKTGLIDEPAAVALIKSDLPSPRQKRVVWEELWEESQGG